MQALRNSAFTLLVRNPEAPKNSASYRSAGLSDDKAAAKGLKDEKLFPESENKLGLSSPAQALACPLKEAPPEPLPDILQTHFQKLLQSRPHFRNWSHSLLDLKLFRKDSLHPHEFQFQVTVFLDCPKQASWPYLVFCSDLDHVSFFQFKENTVSNTFSVEKETLPKGTGAKKAPLPCENPVRELRTFFTRPS